VSGAVSETGSTCATARQQRNYHSTYVRIKNWLTPLTGLHHPYTPQAACLRATYSGNTQPPRPLGSAQSTDCQHDQLSKQLQFGRGDL
jgi:hypothetical protein